MMFIWNAAQVQFENKSGTLKSASKPMSSHQQIPFNKKKPSISNAYPQKIESVLSGLFQI
jgi:hypothetical protein